MAPKRAAIPTVDLVFEPRAKPAKRKSNNQASISMEEAPTTPPSVSPYYRSPSPAHGDLSMTETPLTQTAPDSMREESDLDGAGAAVVTADVKDAVVGTRDEHQHEHGLGEHPLGGAAGNDSGSELGASALEVAAGHAGGVDLGISSLEGAADGALREPSLGGAAGDEGIGAVGAASLDGSAGNEGMGAVGTASLDGAGNEGTGAVEAASLDDTANGTAGDEGGAVEASSLGGAAGDERDSGDERDLSGGPAAVLHLAEKISAAGPKLGLPPLTAENIFAAVGDEPGRPSGADGSSSATLQHLGEGDAWHHDRQRSTLPSSASSLRALEIQNAMSSAATTASEANTETPAPTQPKRTHVEISNAAAALATAPVNPLCMKCLWPCEVLKAVLKHKASSTAHARYICRPCNNTQTMINRKLKLEGSMSMTSWTGEQLTDFFRKCSKKAEDGRLAYCQVRAVVRDNLIEQTITENSRKISSDYLPLSVWETRGFDTSMIVSYNDREWNPALGWTYGVPIKRVERAHIERKIDEAIAAAERNAKKRKLEDKDGEDDDLDLDDGIEPGTSADTRPSPAPRGSSSTETPAEKKARQKAETRAEIAEKKAQAAEARYLEAEKKKAAEAEAKAVRLHNNKIQILASRATSLLSSPLASLKEVMNKKAHYKEAPSWMMEKVEKVFSTMSDAVTAADQALKNAQQAAKKGNKLADVSFDLKSLGELNKEVASCLADLAKLEQVYLSARKK